MIKKLLMLAAICALAASALLSPPAARAGETAEYPTWTLEPKRVEPLQATAAGCQVPASDTADYLFEIAVTEEMATAFAAGQEEGKTYQLEFQTQFHILVDGAGYAGYQAQISATIDHLDGTRTVLDAREVGVAGSDSVAQTDWIAIELPDGLLQQVMHGDNIAVQASASGAAGLAECDAGGQAALSWEIGSHLAGDPDRPIITGRAR